MAHSIWSNFDPKWSPDLLLKAFAAIWALLLFRRRVKAERAKWVTQLYQKFYENDDLKKVRDRLDCSDENAIKTFVDEESKEFTDYLNFFKYLAYLWKAGQLTSAEVRVLVGYYMKCLRKSPSTIGYIDKTEHGFIYLSGMLRKKKLMR